MAILNITYLVILCLLPLACGIDLWYTEIKPYIYLEKGETRGIIPMIFENANLYCSSSINISYKLYHDINTNKDEEHTENKETKLYQNTSDKKMEHYTNIYTPYIKYTAADFIIDHYSTYNVFHVKSLAVLHRRKQISLPVKIFRGVKNCSQILLLCALLSIAFGITVWLFERCNNPMFETHCFLRGGGTGIWWSVVTMSSVGYGDIVPVSAPGKGLAYIWLLAGVMVTAVVTATVTDTVTGISGLEISQSSVAVLNNSWEMKIAKEHYDATTWAYESYKDVFDALRTQEHISAALVNSDIAAWEQETIFNDTQGSPLSIVYTIPHEIPINMLVTNEDEIVSKIFSCIVGPYKKYILDESIESYKRYMRIETIYYDTLVELFTDHTTIYAGLGFTVFLILIGLCLDALHYSNVTCINKAKEQIVKNDEANYEEEKDSLQLINSELTKLTQNLKYNKSNKSEIYRNTAF